LANSDWPIL